MDIENSNKSFKLPVPMDSGILYTIVALYYVYASQLIGRFQFSDTIKLIISQLLFLLVPPLLLAYIRKYDIKKTFRLKAPRPLEVLLMLVISPVMVIAGFCAGFIALFGVKAIFGRVLLTGEVADFMSHGVLISLILVAVIPAFCEEFLFRGMIQRGMERLGVGWSIFLSGLLFGLFHFDFQRLAAQTLIGFISAYVIYRTGSIFNGMILHFMNNGLLTLMALSFSAKAIEGADVQVVTDPFSTPEFLEMAESSGMTLNQFLGSAAVVLAVVLVFSLFILFGLLIILRAITKKTIEKPEIIKGSGKGLLIGIPGLLLIVIVYISLGLMLTNNPLGLEIVRFLGIS